MAWPQKTSRPAVWSKAVFRRPGPPDPPGRFTVAFTDDVHAPLACRWTPLLHRSRRLSRPSSMASAPTAASAPQETRSKSSVITPISTPRANFVYDSKKIRFSHRLATCASAAPPNPLLPPLQQDPPGGLATEWGFSWPLRCCFEAAARRHIAAQPPLPPRRGAMRLPASVRQAIRAQAATLPKAFDATQSPVSWGWAGASTRDADLLFALGPMCCRRTTGA